MVKEIEEISWRIKDGFKTPNIENWENWKY